MAESFSMVRMGTMEQAERSTAQAARQRPVEPKNEELEIDTRRMSNVVYATGHATGSAANGTNTRRIGDARGRFLDKK